MTALLSTYSLEEYLQWGKVEPQLEGLINDRIEELQEAYELVEQLETKLGNIECAIQDILSELYVLPLREWQERTILKPEHTPEERIEKLIEAIHKINGMI